MTRDEAEAEILNDYIDLLNAHGLGAAAELAFLRRHESEKDVLRLLSATRALKAAFAAVPGPRAGRFAKPEDAAACGLRP